MWSLTRGFCSYKCVGCRGREVPPAHVSRAVAAASASAGAAAARPAQRPTPQSLGLAGEYYVDDVCLSQRGAHHMKQLEADMGITHTRRKRRFKNDNTEKDAGKYSECSCPACSVCVSLLLFACSILYLYVVLIWYVLYYMDSKFPLYIWDGIDKTYCLYITSMPIL